MLELIFFSTAFVCGFVIFQLRLPPLIGFLAAGFILRSLGYQSTDILESLSAVGVSLLLFSIGLKLEVKTLAQSYVWIPASLHIIICSSLFSALMLLLGYFALPLFSDLTLQTALLIGFAFSFSSTVFAVKVLEERGEMASFHGKLSIAILVMQDLFAVIFLAISTGMVPNIWALAIVVVLPVMRPVLFKILDRSKHGELMPLFRFFFAIMVGYQLFEFGGLKGDLGALVVGMLFAPHAKARELAKSLLSLKDLMLVGFFLTIGLNAQLSTPVVFAALVLVALLPLKVFLYYLLTSAFRVRARTSLLNSFTLANYSEFGLIVCAVAASSQWVSYQWLAVVGIAVSLTFIVASPLNNFSNQIYIRYEAWLTKFETLKCLELEQPVQLHDAQVLIFGMGRIGAGAYDSIEQHSPGIVSGVDIKPASAEFHRKRGCTVIIADATDPNFWQRINHSNVRMIMLSMPKHIQNMLALEQLKASGYKGTVSAIAAYPDQQKELEELGAHSTYNFYLEAGSGFGEHVFENL